LRVGRRVVAVWTLRRPGLRHRHPHWQAAEAHPRRSRATRAMCLAPAGSLLARSHGDHALRVVLRDVRREVMALVLRLRGESTPEGSLMPRPLDQYAPR